MKTNQNLLPKHIKVKRDRIFILVLIITVGGLAWKLMTTLYSLGANWKYLPTYMGTTNWGSETKITDIAIIIANIVAITGVLWLLRSYRRTIRLLKQKKLEEIQNESRQEE